MKIVQKILIIGSTFLLALIALLIYLCYADDNFCNFLENYNFPESHIPSEAVGIWVIKN